MEIDWIQAVLFALTVTLSLAWGYSIGHKDGHREGYMRGREITRARVMR